MILKKHPKYPKETRFDKLAKKLYAHNVPQQIQLRIWDNLNLKVKDYWRGRAQITLDRL